MKKIYIVQVELPTIVNRVVKFITGYKYNHFSISLDDNLDKLYSFQVSNMNTFLVGGFLEESEVHYFHGKKDLKLKEFVYEISVSDEEYDRVNTFIENVKNDKEYIFNYISSLFMFSFGGIKGYKAFHCTEFIAEILLLLDDVKIPREPHLMRPKDLVKVLKKYKVKEKEIYSEDYEIPNNVFLKKIYFCVKESFCRVIFKRASKNFNYKNIKFYKKDCE